MMDRWSSLKNLKYTLVNLSDIRLLFRGRSLITISISSIEMDFFRYSKYFVSNLRGCKNSKICLCLLSFLVCGIKFGNISSDYSLNFWSIVTSSFNFCFCLVVSSIFVSLANGLLIFFKKQT